jgi:hypothetical protein
MYSKWVFVKDEIRMPMPGRREMFKQDFEAIFQLQLKMKPCPKFKG